MASDSYPSRVSDKPSVLPRAEPACYSRWRSDAPLSEELTRFFDRHGYLTLENLFDTDEVALLNDEARRLRGLDGDDLEAGTAITEPGSDEIRSIFRIHAQNGRFARLAADSRLVSVARYLLDDEVYIHQSRLNYKPGFRGKEFYWHSDFETWHVEDGMPRMRALSMSVLLTENTPDNGPLMLIPGSHRSFVSCVGETPEDHYKESLKKQEYGVPDDDSLTKLVAGAGIVAPTGPPGTVVIFDCNTMHGSNSNITPFPRANAFFVFNAISNALTTPYGGKSPRPDFIATRGQMRAIEPVDGRLER